VALLEAVPRYLNCRLFFWPGEDEGFQNFASNYAAQKKSHKFRFRFHDLRHKLVVDYLRRGGNIYDLQKVLGHSSIKTTELYLNYLDPEEQKIGSYRLKGLSILKAQCLVRSAQRTESRRRPVPKSAIFGHANSGLSATTHPLPHRKRAASDGGPYSTPNRTRTKQIAASNKPPSTSIA
jgi:hypothetical protein